MSARAAAREDGAAEEKGAAPEGASDAKPATEDAAAAAPEKTAVVSEWKHSGPLFSCRFDPRGRFVFTGAQDRGVERWKLDDGAVTLCQGHESWVRAIAFDSAGDTLVTGGYDGRLIWWPVEGDALAPRRVVETGHGWVRAVAVSPRGEYVASAGNDGLVKLWSLGDGKLVRALAGHGCHVYNAVFHPSPEGTPGLATADLKGVVIHWDLEKGAEARRLDASALYKYDGGFRADIGGARAMRFSPDGRRLVAAGITNVSNAFAGVGNPLAVVFDWESGQAVQKHEDKEKPQGVVWGAVFHPDGFLVGATGGGAGGFLLFWRQDKPEEFHKLKLPSPCRDVDLHPDGRRLVTAHFDGTVRVLRM